MTGNPEQAAPRVMVVETGAVRTHVAAFGAELANVTSYDTPPDQADALVKLGAMASWLFGGTMPDAVGVSQAGVIDHPAVSATAAGFLQRDEARQEAAEQIAGALELPSADRVVILPAPMAGANAQRLVGRSEPPAAGAFVRVGEGGGMAVYTGADESQLILGEGQTLFISELTPSIQRSKPYAGILHNVKAFRERGIHIRSIGFTGLLPDDSPWQLSAMQHFLEGDLGQGALAVHPAFYNEQSGLYGAGFAVRSVLEAL